MALAEADAIPPDVRVITMGGEPLSREVLDRVREVQAVHCVGPMAIHESLMPLGPILKRADDCGCNGPTPIRLAPGPFSESQMMP